MSTYVSVPTVCHSERVCVQRQGHKTRSAHTITCKPRKKSACLAQQDVVSEFPFLTVDNTPISFLEESELNFRKISDLRTTLHSLQAGLPQHADATNHWHLSQNH